MSNKAITVYAQALAREKQEKQHTTEGATSTSTREAPSPRERSSDSSRADSRSIPRELPTRDEVQEFSFRLRDELKVKVQAEVPHRWQKELEDMARELGVRKLELYRFILGEFLGKVRRKRT